MSLGAFGIKLGMTRVFLKDGTAVPVTAIRVPKHTVVAIRTVEKDGYNAVQVGAFETTEKKLTKPEIGHLKKAGVKLLRRLKEFRVEKPTGLPSGTGTDGGRPF
jgi:large subunit ribosomal protein L3